LAEGAALFRPTVLAFLIAPLCPAAVVWAYFMLAWIVESRSYSDLQLLYALFLRIAGETAFLGYPAFLFVALPLFRLLRLNGLNACSTYLSSALLVGYVPYIALWLLPPRIALLPVYGFFNTGSASERPDIPFIWNVAWSAIATGSYWFIARPDRTNAPERP